MHGHHRTPTGEQASGAVKSIKSFLKPYYNKYDADHNGTMDSRELKLLFRDLGEMVNDAKLQTIVDKYDADGDGVVSLDEFCALMVGLAKEELDSSEIITRRDRSISMPTTKSDITATQV